MSLLLTKLQDFLHTASNKGVDLAPSKYDLFGEICSTALYNQFNKWTKQRRGRKFKISNNR